MSDLRGRGGDAGAIDPDGESFAAEFDREFGAPAVATTVIDEPPPALPSGDGDGEEASAGPADETLPVEPEVPPRSSLPARTGMRIIRRPYQWVKRPWPDERVIRVAVTVASLVVTTFIMMRVVHLNPFSPGDDLIFDDVTPTGGDMGAHVWGPAYLRDHLLPSWQLSGWSMDWYGGLPVYRFYMVIPALAIVALDTILPYGVAFKLVVIFGLVTLPFSAWAFGRLARFRFPIPELFAFGALCFLLNESTTIYGGNVLATMAGEFSFSIAISFMLLGLGLLARGLEDGKANHLVWAALVLALACLSHGIVLIYTAVGALVILACRSGADLWRMLGDVLSRPRAVAATAADDADEPGHEDEVATRDPDETNRQLVYAVLSAPAVIGLAILLWQLAGVTPMLVVLAVVVALGVVAVLSVRVGLESASNRLFVKRLLYGLSIGGLTMLLAAFWVGPFLFDHDYMTDMKYGWKPDGGSETFWTMIFDQHPAIDILVNTLAVVGLLASIARRHIYGIALGLITIIATLSLWPARDSLPVIGLLWNPRLLPWIYLMRYLLMMVGAAEVAALAVNFVRNRPAREVPGIGTRSLIATATALVVLIILGFVYQVLPGGSRIGDQYAWGPFYSNHGAPAARADGWTAYNFRGYEGRELYPEYHDLVQTMAGIGEDRGCGRALWEIDNRSGVGNGKYGTTMALMLLPHWTDGCIASMEGLYFEASGSTPYHFLTAAAMSKSASNPVRELRYTNNDASVGIDYLQAQGVSYVMLTTHEAVAEADSRPELEKIATSGPWHIYEVADAAIVEPLAVQPVVVNEREGDPRECFLELGTSWFQNQDDWAAMPATGGPAEWQRIDVAVDLESVDPEGQDVEGCGTPQAPRGRNVHVVQPVQEIEPVELDPITVSNVDVGDQSVEFDVDRVGVPVLVRVSYFPNWSAAGAEGPYRIGPNQMVVIPTDTNVRLEFQRSTTDYLFYAMTVIGIGLAVFARLRGDWKFPTVTAAPAVAAAPPTDFAPPPPPTTSVWMAPPPTPLPPGPAPPPTPSPPGLPEPPSLDSPSGGDVDDRDDPEQRADDSLA